MLPNWYNQYKELINKSIIDYLDLYFENQTSSEGFDDFREAVYYSVKGGKRIRSVLAIEFYLYFSNKKFEDIKIGDDILEFCISIELLHAYSLVHDDLPAIDNDILRRGEETTWKKYGESNAILVGDFLNTISFDILAQIGNIALIKEFSKAVGFKGMIGGQILDIYYEHNSNKLNIEKLIETHNKKTGKLIQISVLGGILIGNLELERGNKIKKSDIIKYEDFGQKIGLAFQVKDDLLDIEGTIEETGKSIGGENKGFVHFIGIKESKDYLNNLINESLNIIRELKSEKLNFLVSYIGNRKK